MEDRPSLAHIALTGIRKESGAFAHKSWMTWLTTRAKANHEIISFNFVACDERIRSRVVPQFGRSKMLVLSRVVWKMGPEDRETESWVVEELIPGGAQS
jgi:hypothetical protein